ncbi:HD domain-containing protein [Glycomyces salinus]|uniref:HD domain-containing protein n=1 Tax=Glycomyces salinus TaxID=980294 RepID=UPI0018ECFC4D|nr:HD domain-containing protein [Glycomyces salinus]
MPIASNTLQQLRTYVAKLYRERMTDVPFHGWHHLDFVARKSKRFAAELGADESLVEASALVHDLNYLVDRRSEAGAGAVLRREILSATGFSDPQIERIESIVASAETKYRDEEISVEAQALSDADTLFKALPITPVVLAPLYLRETGRSIRELAEKIVGEQVPLNQKRIYFYTASAREKYQTWADANLSIWKCVLESLDDPDVEELIAIVGKAEPAASLLPAA